MAELMGPYDPASPCLTTFCKRISKDDYEKQASDYTQNALAELIEYLEYNPTAYHNILRKRKREDAESGGVFSFLKAKMLTTIFGDEYLEKLDESEAKKKLSALKDDIRSSYDYAEEAKGSGKRFSRRIANRTRLSNIHRESDGKIAKKLEIELECSNQSNNVTNISSSATAPGHKQTTVIPVPPPPPPVLPPPPPPLPPSTRLPDQDVSKQPKQPNKQLLTQENMNKFDGPITRSQLNANKMGRETCESAADQLMASLKNPNTRAALRTVGNPDLSPYQRRQQINSANSDKENEFPLFNQKLITKFQNARSPKSPMESQYLSDVSSPDSFASSP